MGNDYVPRRDAEVAAWLKNFAAGLAEDPGRYGQTGADAAHVAALVEAYLEAFEVARDPGTRTRGAVAVKDEARDAAVRLCRAYSMLIKANRGVADADKLGLRIHPVNPRRTAVRPPETSPWLKLIGATPGSHTLRFSDGADAPRRGKPFGVIGLQLFVHVGEGKAAVTPGQAAYRLTCTRNPVGVGFEAEDGGKVATYFGRWCSRRGEVGPWSLPVRMHVV